MATHIITNPKVEIDQELRAHLQEMVKDEGQVVLHFIYVSLGLGDLIRIWPTTFLYDYHSSHKSDLVHMEGITMYPTWTPCTPGVNSFSLFFSGLPADCVRFDFVEHCMSQGGNFEVRGIQRNATDVYFLKIG